MVSARKRAETSKLGTEAERRFALEQAEHSGEMEGLHVSPEARADAEEWIAGRLDVDELVERGRARYDLH